MLVSLAEYAQKIGKSPSRARRMAIAGRLSSARKIGSVWVIDDSEPWPDDNRVTSGRYIGVRHQQSKRSSGGDT